METVKIKHYSELAKDFTGVAELPDGMLFWKVNGISHREDGPAVINAEGDKYYYLNGEYHRVDGPAIERANGHKEWFQNGKHFRKNGPAYEGVNGYKIWYTKGGKQKKVEMILGDDLRERWGV
jgi:hypothetical protein